jgi:hypothetical protein
MTAPDTGRIAMKDLGSLQIQLKPIEAVGKIKNFGHC